MTSDPPAYKRSRTIELEEAEENGVECKNCDINEGEGDDNNDSILEPIRPTVMLQSNDYAKSYSEAKPFPHGIIHNFCKEGFLGECECVRLRVCVDLFPPFPFADGLLCVVLFWGLQLSCRHTNPHHISHVITLQKLPPRRPASKIYK